MHPATWTMESKLLGFSLKAVAEQARPQQFHVHLAQHELNWGQLHVLKFSLCQGQPGDE